MADGISVSVDTLKEKYNEIAEIDEQLAAASGSTTRGKRAIANQLITEYEGTFGDKVEAVVKTFADFDDDVLAAAVYSLKKAVKDELEERVDDFLEAKVAETQEETPELSEDEVSGLVDTRKERYQEYKAVKEILEMFGEDISGVPEPKSMRGARGPRGPRALSKYQYSLDGEALPSSRNTIASIASENGFEKAKDLRDFLKEQEIDTSNPPVEWEVELPNGVTLSASKKEEFITEEDEEEEEEEVEEGEVEEEETE